MTAARCAAATIAVSAAGLVAFRPYGSSSTKHGIH